MPALPTEYGKYELRLPEWGTGTVTIFFSDIEGFTDYVDRFGDTVAHELLQVHHSIIREELRRHGGVEVKTLGDGFMAVFPSARASVLCAAQIQKRFVEHNRLEPERPIHVRIGLHAGEPIYTERDFIGQAVNLTSRITACAQGGQVFVSEVVRQLAGSAVGVRFEDRGWKTLKGFQEKQHVYEVVWEEEVSTRPPLDLSHWLGEGEVVVRLNAWRLLWAGLRFLFQRRHLLILVPFLVALLTYYLSNFLIQGPSITVEKIPQSTTPAVEKSASSSVKSSFNPWILLQWLLLTLLSPVIAGMTVRMVVNAVEGQRLLPTSELWTFILGRYKTLLGASLLYTGLAILGIYASILTSLIILGRLGTASNIKVFGIVVSALPGIYILARCSLYMPAVLLEGRHAWESLIWSWRATSGNGGTLLGITFIPVLFLTSSIAPLYIFMTLWLGAKLVSAEAWRLVVSQFLGIVLLSYDPFVMLINPWALAALTLAYLQLREGLAIWVAQHIHTQQQ